jgi:hypothetical protein
MQSHNKTASKHWIREWWSWVDVLAARPAMTMLKGLALRAPHLWCSDTLRRLLMPVLRMQSHMAMMIQGLVLVVLIGVLDFLSGYELSFSLLYFAPILLVTWWAGRRAGVAVASLSTLVWCGAEIASGRMFTHPLMPFWNALMHVSCFLSVVMLLARLKHSYEAQRRMAWEWQASFTHVKRLSGLIPICAWCKQVRNDQGSWQQVEAYLAEHFDATFTHSICQDCQDKELHTLLHP